MGLPGRQQSVLDMLALIQVCSLLAVATAAPQFRAISEVVNSQTGEVIPVDENNQDIAGCLVGPSGERVCPLVAVGSDGRSRVSARGNRGPGLTGSNGNAGPVNAAGQAYDPAAETYKKSKLTLVGPSSRWRMPRVSWELLGNKETK